jgi:Domain of unknown function (DUF2017)
VKVSRRHGRLRLRLEVEEVTLMSMLLDELDTLLDSDVDPHDEVLQRLYPAAYQHDPEAETEFRSLTESSLRTARSERIAACRADLLAAPDVELSDPDAGRRWIQVLNDLRLALGTRLGITEDDDPDLDPADPAAQPRVIYYWLTAVQDSVVQGLMG